MLHVQRSSCSWLHCCWRSTLVVLLCSWNHSISHSFPVVSATTAMPGSNGQLLPLPQQTSQSTTTAKNSALSLSGGNNIYSSDPAMAETEVAPTIVSECACGKVKLHIRLPNANDKQSSASSATAVDCHCPACRKFHIAAFGSYVEVPSDRVEYILEEDEGRQSSLQTYQESCSELGPVERQFCRHCYSKMATKPITGASTSIAASSQEETSLLQSSTTTATHNPDKRVLLNMGGFVDETIPKAYQNAWKSSRRAWQQAESQATWAKARPPRRIPSGGMPSLQSTATTGSCACGKCRYQIRHVPDQMQHCYCRLCRQCCGSAFQTWIPVYSEDFAWTTDPAPALQRTTNHGQRHFCTTCGAAMTIVYDEDPDVVWPAAGGLDDASIPSTREEMSLYMERVVHICCVWKPSWYSIPNDGLERIDYAC